MTLMGRKSVIIIIYQRSTPGDPRRNREHLREKQIPDLLETFKPEKMNRSNHKDWKAGERSILACGFYRKV
jgi:hypothetical protein